MQDARPGDWSASAIQRELSGLGFPTNKDEIIVFALDRGADPSLIRTLQGMPERDYASWEDFMRGLVATH